MARFGCSLVLFVAGGLLAQSDWKSSIRGDHPRLFFNKNTWPAVKARALGEEAALLAAMRTRVEQRASEPLESRDYGVEAAEAAFVFLVSGDANHRDLARNLLARSIEFYNECYRQKKTVNWYTFSRINAWAAYDWLFEHLAPADRARLGSEFLTAVRDVQPTKARRAFDRENWGSYSSGFYSTPSLLWYSGLATYKEGINDELAERHLTEGYEQFMKLLAFRRNAAADDGGSASGALNYCLAAYPWAEFNFFHTYESATGKDIAREWPYVAYLPA